MKYKLYHLFHGEDFEPTLIGNLDTPWPPRSVIETLAPEDATVYEEPHDDLEVKEFVVLASWPDESIWLA